MTTIDDAIEAAILGYETRTTTQIIGTDAMTTTTDQAVEEFRAGQLQEQVSDAVEAYARMVLDDGTGSAWRFEPAKQTTLVMMRRLAHSSGMLGHSSPECLGVIDAAVRRLLGQDIDLPLTDIERERLRND